jgi:hypothetical protein
MDQTRYFVSTHGLEVTLEGPRRLVEELYREISRDLALLPREEAPPSGDPAAEAPAWGSIWVYLRTEHLHKVYLVEREALAHHLMGRFLDVDRVRRVHAHEPEALLFAALEEDDQTLWAEVTEAGRAWLREVAQGEGRR